MSDTFEFDWNRFFSEKQYLNMTPERMEEVKHMAQQWDT